MQFRHLGNSGMKVSAISYGNWLTHGSQVETKQAKECVRAALDAGITTFDTADTYVNGAAEKVLGKALKHERREGLEVFTKVYFPTGEKTHNDTGLSRKHIMESINGSLRRLGMDYVDLYQAHRFDHFTPIEETMQAFADVVGQGKALYIGVSEWTPEQIRRGHELATQLGIQLVSNQPQYNMVHRIIEPEVMPTCRELGVSQVVFSPLYEGVLTGKYLPDAEVPADSRAASAEVGQFIKGKLGDVELLRRVQQLVPIAEELDISMAQLALAWILTHDNVASCIAGASRPEQIAGSAAAADVVLPDEVLARIDEVLGDRINADASQVGEASPKERLV